jgi:hypothetical protein
MDSFVSFVPESFAVCARTGRRSWARKTQSAAGGKEKAVVFASYLLKFTMTSSVAFAVSVVDGAMKVVNPAVVLAQSQRFIRSLLSTAVLTHFWSRSNFFFSAVTEYILEPLLVFLGTDRLFQKFTAYRGVPELENDCASS